MRQQESITHGQYQIVEEINKVLTRVTRINKNLLLLAKMENNQFQKFKYINISTIAIEVQLNLAEHFSAKKMQLTTAIDAGIILEGNATLIEILLNNLLLNTIKHSDIQADIYLIVTKKGIVVSNSGNHILFEDKLYKRFASLTKTSAGSGLGLAIIKQVCEVHHWKIEYSFDKNQHNFSVSF
ncbi:MAG: signal transduction histidine kinase [Flavobacteriales bacterium]